MALKPFCWLAIGPAFDNGANIYHFTDIDPLIVKYSKIYLIKNVSKMQNGKSLLDR
jgi:hypothetical protein